MNTHPKSEAITRDPNLIGEAPLDRTVFLAVLLLLTCFGIVAIHTSSVTTRQEGFEPIYTSKHLTHLAIASLLLLAAATRPAKFWQQAALPAVVLTLVGLILVMIPGIGKSAGGATRWLRVPGFSIQPSEWAKFSVPLLIAATGTHWFQSPRGQLSSADRNTTGRFLAKTFKAAQSTARQWALAATLSLIAIALVMKQPDLGTSVLIALAASITLWFSGLKMRWFIALGACLLPFLATLSLRGYQLRRITGLVDAWRDWRDAPYQLRQSLIAFGEGGWNGVGLGRGWQKLSFLPESHTDFVVAVIGEELGFLGLVGIATLWLALLYTGLSMASRCEDRFSEAIAASFVVMLVMQAALNVGVAVAVIPPTGIPHPLLSYGGNSLLVTASMLGVTLSCTRNRGTVAQHATPECWSREEADANSTEELERTAA